VVKFGWIDFSLLSGGDFRVDLIFLPGQGEMVRVVFILPWRGEVIRVVFILPWRGEVVRMVLSSEPERSYPLTGITANNDGIQIE